MMSTSDARKMVPTGLPKSQSVRLQRMEIVSVRKDHLVCSMIDTDGAEVSEVMVAKPWLLRRSPFDGQTRDGIEYTYTDDQARTADNGIETQSELVIPKYLPGDIIYAAYNIGGGTGATGAPDPPPQATGMDPPEPFAEQQLVWLDINADARAWAKAAT